MSDTGRTEQEEQCVEKWREHKRELDDIKSLKRRADKRLLALIDEAVQQRFSDNAEGNRWKVGIERFRNNSSEETIDAFADRFFWEVFGVMFPQRKRPLTLSSRPPPPVKEE
jgi:hypothetical protein